eukprot:COSAG03_NODE_2275_length_2925_cov_2.778839_2_plen_287_part_00
MLRCESLQRHYLSVPLDHNGYYDVAIWLRRACLAPDHTPDARVVEIPSYMGRRCLYTDVTVRSGWRVRLATVHLESTGSQGPVRKAQLDAIFPALKGEPWSSGAEQSKSTPGLLLPDIAVLTGDFNLCACSEENSTVAREPGVTDLWPTLEAGPGWTENTAINEMRFAAKRQHKQVRFDRVLLLGHPGGGAPAADGETAASEWRGTRVALLGTAPLASATRSEGRDLLETTSEDTMRPGGADARVWPSDHFGLVADIAPPGVSLTHYREGVRLAMESDSAARCAID